MWAINKFREKLSAGQVCVGSAVSFADPLVSEALAGSADFLWIDLEHSPMSPEALQGHLLAARAAGTPALVRVVSHGTANIKPVLDSGAEGIIVPQVRSADEVYSVVADCRYPPIGRRGYGPRVPSNYGRNGGDDYVAEANRNLLVSVQIETAEAVDALDAIVRVPGLDSLVLGPWDLSFSLGFPGQVHHPRVVEAMELTIRKAREAGLFVGCGMGTDPAFAALMASRGVQWLQVGGDYGLMIYAAEQMTEVIRRRIADGAATSSTPTAYR